MVEKIAQKLVEFAYPGRKFQVEKVGKRLFVIECDTVGCRDYMLKGYYTYDRVKELNAMTNYSCGFGHCKELGSVAFIGVPNASTVTRRGYFKHVVQYYGQNLNDEEYFFEPYSDEVASKISNYTVYGLGDPRVLKNAAPVKYVKHFYDDRFQTRYHFWDRHKKGDVLEMTIELDGKFNITQARKFAYGSTGECTSASGEDMPVQFAIVGDSRPVGIIGLWEGYEDVYFRDVWGKGEKQPKREKIRFLSDEEAKKINDYTLFYYYPTHSFGKKKFKIKKLDRTMEEGFDFILPDGTDLRLQKPLG